MRLLLLALALNCAFSNFSYSQESDNPGPIDPRILLHYPPDVIASMDSEKFANIKYYYCDSYTIDSSNAEDFDINSFDITAYEQYRHESEYKTIETDGLKITFAPKNTAIYLLHYNPKNYRHE